MSNRFIKFLIIFLLIFSAQLTILQILLLRPQLAQAALPRIETENPEKTKEKCPCSSQASSANEAVRLYIPIPWVTDGCGYVCDVNNDGKANVVDYIVSIYKFLVGLAAILAVIMIVWGGLLRIFSGGQANRISASNDTIVSAIIGLVLALISVSLLQAINPALTNVELPSLTNIGRVSVAGIFATDDDIMLREDSELVALNNQILTDQEAQNLLTQNSKLKTQNHSLKFKTDLISVAKAQATVMPGSVDDLLRQEMAYEKDETQPNCDKDTKKMCFSLTINPDDHINGKLIKGSALKCNSVVDVKVAHINFKEDTDPITFKKIKTNMIKSIECYHGLCDKEKNTHATDNQNAIIEFIKINYIQANWDRNQNGCAVRSKNDCIISSEGKDVGSAFAYGQDCSEIGSTGLCLVEFGKGADAVRCIDVKSLCESSDKTACDDVNNQIHNDDLYGDKFKDMGCARRYDKWTKGFGFAGGDNCVFGPYLYCPAGWNRVSYTMGEKGECWVENKDKEQEPRNFGNDWKWFHWIPLMGPPIRWTTGMNIYVLNEFYPSIFGTSAICCQNPVPVNGQYQYKAITEFWTISVANELEKYNLDLQDSKCKSNAGENKQDGFKLMWQENGVMKEYKDEGNKKTIAAGYNSSNPIKGENSKSYCDNPNVLKICYVPYRPLNIAEAAAKFYEIGNNSIPEFNRGIFSTSQDCIDGAKEYFFGLKRCQAHLVPREFCCIGEINCGAAASVDDGGDEGGGSESNPLVQLEKNNPKITDAFKQGAEALNTAPNVPAENFTPQAEAILRALAITESGGKAKPEDSGKGYYGLMQLSPTEIINNDYLNKPVIANIAKSEDVTIDWLEKNPDLSIKIATNYVVDMLKNIEKICPVNYTPKGMPNRICDYQQDDGGEFYSQCQDAIYNGTLPEKLKYIYAAYNGGAGANCHNQTNFNPSPPCGLCPDYASGKGSIWECDAKTGLESYEQTRGGALRMVDCYNQFKKNLNPDKLEGCCSAGQASCLTTCPAG